MFKPNFLMFLDLKVSCDPTKRNKAHEKLTDEKWPKNKWDRLLSRWKPLNNADNFMFLVVFIKICFRVFRGHFKGIFSRI